MTYMDRSKLDTIKRVHFRLISSLVLHDHMFDLLVNVREFLVRLDPLPFCCGSLSNRRNGAEAKLSSKLIYRSKRSPTLRQHAQQVSTRKVAQKGLSDLDWRTGRNVESIDSGEVAAEEKCVGHDRS
jgi:hypothetical protein